MLQNFNRSSGVPHKMDDNFELDDVTTLARLNIQTSSVFPVMSYRPIYILYTLLSLAESHVSLTLLRKPEKEHPRLSKTPTSPSSISIHSSKSGGSDRITHPIPADVSVYML